MTHYYSATTGGFYDDEIFGPRQIEVINETAQAEAMSAAYERDQADFEAAVEASEDPQEVLRSDFLRCQRAVLNDPVMHLIQNKACRLPLDAVAVSDGEYQAVMDAQAQGKVIVPSLNGLPMARDVVLKVEDVLHIVRRARDDELRATDWTQLPDALSAAQRDKWKAHRAAMRALPNVVRSGKKVAEGLSRAEMLKTINALIAKTRPMGSAK